MSWNHDMSAAPKGQTVQVKRLVTDKSSASGKSLRTIEEFKQDHLILASKCGKVTRSYWIPNEQRWCMFAKGEEPVAWQKWPEWPEVRA